MSNADSNGSGSSAEAQALDSSFMGHPQPLRSLFLPKCGSAFHTTVSVTIGAIYGVISNGGFGT